MNIVKTKPSVSRHTAPEGVALGLMTLEQVASELGLSKAYLYSLTSKRIIPHYKPRGGRVFFDASEVREWVLTGRIKTTAELEVQAEAHGKALEENRRARRGRSNVASV